MFGWPLLVLGGLGLVLLPFRPTPGGHIGASLGLATFPFVIFDPFHSPFWSHRTAVYFGIGLAILVGVAIVSLVQGALALARRLPTGPAAPIVAGAPLQTAAKPARIAPLVAVSGIFLLVCLAGGVYAATPPQYEGGWYRLYPECEFDALREVAATAEANPGLLIITGSWQSKLVISGLADDAGRMWYKPDFFSDEAERANVIQMMQQKGEPILVVVDSRLPPPEHPDLDASFLNGSPWTSYSSWCADGQTGPGAGAALGAYTLEA
jgi:hypothetical protein